MKNTTLRLVNSRTAVTKDEDDVASPSSQPSPTTRVPVMPVTLQRAEPKKVKSNVPRRTSPSKYAAKPKKADAELANVGAGRQTVGQKTKDALRGQFNRLLWR